MSRPLGNITLYLNVYRKDNELEPHYRGKINIGKENFDCSVWINTDITGVPIHLSGQVTLPKED